MGLDERHRCRHRPEARPVRDRLDGAHQPARDPRRSRVAQGRARGGPIRKEPAIFRAPRTYARTWEIPKAYGSYEELLADPEIEAVYISLPNTLHCEWSIRALEGAPGKHVLCEEAVLPPRGRRGGASSTRPTGRGGSSRRRSCTATTRRRRTGAPKLVSSAALIGELRLVRSTFSYGLYDPENIRLRTDLEGGSLMDVGCYCVSGSRLVAGEPESVFGTAWTGGSGTDWLFAATMRHAGNVIAQFDCGTALPDRDELEVIGSEGSLFLDDPWHCRRPVIELRRDGGVELLELETVDSYRLELENLSDAIRGEAELLLGREDAVAQARVLEALHASSERSLPVTLLAKAAAARADASRRPCPHRRGRIWLDKSVVVLHTAVGGVKKLTVTSSTRSLARFPNQASERRPAALPPSARSARGFESTPRSSSFSSNLRATQPWHGCCSGPRTRRSPRRSNSRSGPRRCCHEGLAQGPDLEGLSDQAADPARADRVRGDGGNRRARVRGRRGEEGGCGSRGPPRPS